ncbi:MAG: RagB/SusD family nutrient uptake outer membrane protein [Bacteroidetes bacterium]|uniref:RagB/SusD family nutrient uptake outer membrane protein n=1 Tax=Candidatus Cryptobacteroides faecipullorum TaxID=2840764 RepID=A0A9D9I5B6_9BACT|nr:RagB/SusD family nutrient uptake outer membrane protein [Candidatus Cryptobacteroides faecipullorum]
MNNVFKTAAAAVSVVFLLEGCIKEATPTDVATEDQVSLETTVRGIPAALVQAGSTGYANQGAAWDFALPAIHLATESMTGDLVVTGNIGYDWFSQWGTNDALGADYAVGALTWDNYYTWIMMANSVISQIDASDLSSLESDEKTYLGFAYAYRAMFYFDLVRLYEFKKNTVTQADDVLGLGVPIVLPETTEAQAKNNPRAKVDDIYDTVIFPDLDMAEELLATYAAPDKYTISLAFVYGMKARAYLERGTAFNDAGNTAESVSAYKSAAEYARKAITASGCTPLTQDQWEDPINGFNNAGSNNAWIWGLALPSESVTNLFCFTAHMSCENDWAPYHAGRGISRNLYNSINLKDFRRHSWLDPDRGSYDYKSCRDDADKYFAESLADYANIKFRPAQGAYEAYNVGGAADHCCMRVEEMYFIEAEATAQAGDLAGGISLLNDFMTSYRMMDGASYDCSARSTTLSSFINELMLQKRIEFWGEGIVMFDMKRLDMSSKRGYVGTNAPASYRLNVDGRAPYWNFVITRGETQNNPVIATQNNPDPSGRIEPWNG